MANSENPEAQAGEVVEENAAIAQFVADQLEIMDPRMRAGILSLLTAKQLAATVQATHRSSSEGSESEGSDTVGEREGEGEGEGASESANEDTSASEAELETVSWTEDQRVQNLKRAIRRARPYPAELDMQASAFRQGKAASGPLACYSFFVQGASGEHLRDTATAGTGLLSLTDLTRVGTAICRFAARTEVAQFMVGKCSHQVRESSFGVHGIYHLIYRGMSNRYTCKYKKHGYHAFIGFMVRTGPTGEEEVLAAERFFHTHLQEHPKFDRTLSDKSDGNLCKGWKRRVFVMYVAFKFTAVAAGTASEPDVQC